VGPRGELTIEHTASDVADVFPRLRERDGWHTSTMDGFTVIAGSPTKVHCSVVASRFRADGTRYARFHSFYIITEQEGHWGVQFSSGLPASQ
jgi:hypothetical protein